MPKKEGGRAKGHGRKARKSIKTQAYHLKTYPERKIRRILATRRRDPDALKKAEKWSEQHTIYNLFLKIARQLGLMK